MTLPLIVDAHEDIAYNMLSFGRDYLRPADETRRVEKENDAKAVAHTGETLLGWPDYQRGRVAIVFGTLFAPPARFRLGEWDQCSYGTYDEAHDLYWKQLDLYHELTETHPDKFVLIGTCAELDRVLQLWEDPSEPAPVGLVPLMEGAEGVRNPAELEAWWNRGVRVIGPAWVGTRFCGGTHDPGPLTDEGKQLLAEMAEMGYTLDISHMDAIAAHQALDQYQGPIIASHANPAALLQGYTGNRHLSDDLIQSLVERDGIIGIVPYCKFLDAGWKLNDQIARLPLEQVVTHIDYICQLVGDSTHVGFGSDFDGGFGLASVPAEVDTIADLQKISPILAGRGYNDADIASIMGGNWVRHLRTHLPR